MSLKPQSLPSFSQTGIVVVVVVVVDGPYLVPCMLYCMWLWQLMVAIWLAAYLDGALVSNSAGNGKRSTFQLPAKDSLRRQLQQHGGQGFDRQVLRALGGGAPIVNGHLTKGAKDLQVLGLMKVSNLACACREDSLSHFSQEASVQKEYHDMPIDGYELHVQEVASCCSPKDFEVTHRLNDRHFGTAEQTRISLRMPLFRPLWNTSPRGHALSVDVELPPRSVDAVLQSWGLEGWAAWLIQT
jgi:hypothetical protein